MPDLTPGTTILAADFPPSKVDAQNTSGTTTSASYTATLTGGTACGVAFVAPTSGRVLIIHSAFVDNSAANVSACTVAVRTGSSIGSGTDVLVASDTTAIECRGTDEIRASVTRLLDGLTPGASYNAQQAFKASGGTATFADKHLAVIPVP